MRTSENGKTFIKSKEGLKLIAYSLNDGNYTIGYGNTFYEDGTRVKWGDSITQSRADSLFNEILRRFENEVNPLVRQDLTQAQFDAVISYSYNRGVGSFKNSTLRSMINANPNNPAIAEQFVKEWGTNTAYKTALQNRRRQEAEMYFSDSGSGISSNQILAIGGILLLFIIINNSDDVNTEE